MATRWPLLDGARFRALPLALEAASNLVNRIRLLTL